MFNKNWFMLVIIFLFFYVFNYLAPMAFGDDYLYSFIWQGKPMFIPLSEDAVRVSSWNDLFISQWSHYFTWSGRTVNHTIAQFFLWMGKDVFNLFNALISTILVAEIYICIQKGKLSIDNSSDDIGLIFFALWAFTPGYVSVFLWLDGSCNYLWTNTILIGFLIPYVRKYFTFDATRNNKIFAFIFFFAGIIAGWTNENSICWVILLLLVFVVTYRKKEGMEPWLYTGLLGLIIGYSLLMLSPGNVARLHAEHGVSHWFNLDILKSNITMFLTVIFMFQIFLWYFNLRALYYLKSIKNINRELLKQIMLSKIFCLASFGMTGVMLFSPLFPPRSAFSGTIFLIIATGILANIQNKYNVVLIQPNAKNFLKKIAIIYFVVTTVVTFHHSYAIHYQMQELITQTKQFQMKNQNDILVVNSFKPTNHMEDILSGFHVPAFSLSEDENAWMNVAFSRYYSIKGIRMINEKDKKIDKKDD